MINEISDCFVNISRISQEEKNMKNILDGLNIVLRGLAVFISLAAGGGILVVVSLWDKLVGNYIKQTILRP